MRKPLTVIAGLLCLSTVYAQELPEQLVGVWATEGSVFEQEKLIGGEALYLDRNGLGAMVGAPLPVNRCPDGRVCAPIIGFRITITLATDGTSLRIRATEKDKIKELIASYNEQEKFIQFQSPTLIFRRTADIPAHLKAVINANP